MNSNMLVTLQFLFATTGALYVMMHDKQNKHVIHHFGGMLALKSGLRFLVLFTCLFPALTTFGWVLIQFVKFGSFQAVSPL